MSAADGLAVVLSLPEIENTARLRALVEGAEVVVAADGGLAHAAPLDLQPSLVVGDFDSLAGGDLARYPSVERRRHPRAKDALDLELALDEVLARGYRRIVVVGAIGGRLDQTLAAILVAARLCREGNEVVLSNGREEVWPLASGAVRQPGLPAGTVFSLSSLAGDARVDVGGARFALQDAVLPFGVGRGVSNEATGDVRVAVREGLVALTIQWDARPIDQRATDARGPAGG